MLMTYHQYDPKQHNWIIFSAGTININRNCIFEIIFLT